MDISSQKIRDLCDSWCQAIRQPDGGFAISRQSEQYRLLQNGVKFHELNFEQLVASVDGLTKVLLLPGLNSIVNRDHYFLWSWCAEVVLFRETDFFKQGEYELSKLFATCIRASLVGCKTPQTDQAGWQRQIEIEQQIPHNSRYFIKESSLALAYLAFPLLEAVSKKACEKFVAMDGSVRGKFEVTNKMGGSREYNPKGKWNEIKCSSLRDLLFLIYNEVADTKLKSALDKLRMHVSSLDSSEDPFDIIYNWRNQSLHGSTSFNTIGGLLLNLVLLIILSQLSDQYDVLRCKVLEHCQSELQRKPRVSGSFYPPY